MREKEIYSTPREHIIEPCACDHDHFFQLLKCLYYIYMCVCERVHTSIRDNPAAAMFPLLDGIYTYIFSIFIVNR